MTVKTPVKQSTYQGHVIWDADGSAIADCDDPEVARRIVACVNACAGVSTKELESGLPTINAKLDKINAIIDELGAKL